MQQLPEHEKWANEYIEEQLAQKATGDVQQVAKNMTEELTDPDIAATEFMQFVKKLSTGETAIEGNQVCDTIVFTIHYVLYVKP